MMAELARDPFAFYVGGLLAVLGVYLILDALNGRRDQ